MEKWTTFIAAILLGMAANAAWYWPFGSDDDDTGAPRLSTLMEKASEAFDEADDLASEGKFDEAVEQYRIALSEIQRIEMENPDRAKTPEFASVRNKRALANAKIDSILLGQAHDNAKAVAVTDTTELEKKFIAKRAGLDTERVIPTAAPAPAAEPSPAKQSPEAAAEEEDDADAELPEVAEAAPAPKLTRLEKLEAFLRKHPESRKARLAIIGERIAAEQYTAAKADIERLLERNMCDAAALNLKAACLSGQGDARGAEAALNEALVKCPRDFNAYYNMANLKLDTGAKVDVARRYYESGRAVGGPKDADLEARLK